MKNHVKQLVRIVGVGLCAATTVFADGTLELLQYKFDEGIPVAGWAWQSITVTNAANLTTFGFEWNGSSGDTTATATVDLLSGEGLGGTVLATTTGHVGLVTDGPMQGYNFFGADFGNLPLEAGQYTLYIHDPSAELALVAASDDPYSGGKFVSDFTGNAGMDATFATPVPLAIPEPSVLALVGFGALGLFIQRRRARRLKRAA